MEADDFLKIAKALPDPLCLLTTRGQILAANPAACKLFKLDAVTLTARTLLDLVVPEQADKLSQHLRNWSASSQALPASLKLCQDNGECLECHCQGSLLQPRSGDKPGLIVLRCKEKSSLTGGFVALNEKITQLEKQIAERKRTETALAISQQNLERAQAIAHVGSWQWNLKTNEVQVSEETKRIYFGKDAEQFSGLDSIMANIHPDDKELVNESINIALSGPNKNYFAEYRAVRPDGSERHVCARGEVSWSDANEAVSMIGTVQDITEQKKAEAYRRMLFETSPIGLALCDMQGNLVDINPAYARIVGREIEETKKLSYWEITPEDYAEEEQQQLASLNSSGHYGPYEKEYLHNDGHRVPVRLLGQIVEFDGVRYIWSSVENITEAKQAKIALQRANEDLEDRVEQRTAELRSANDHLQNSLQQLSETQEQLVQSEKMASLGGLVAGVAHEINTPVGVGVTAISHLQMKVDEYGARYQSGQLTREDFEALLNAATESSKIIHHNLDRAADLIHSFKQVAVDQTSNELREFNLKEYLHEILQSLKPKLKKAAHQVIINCPDDIVMLSQAGALSQAITNLVMNSVIHGFENRQNGNITIDVKYQTDGTIRLDYRDDGKGISAENVKKIFEPFFTTRRGQGGSGLGMHIVFNLVTQNLGGSIECSSIEGEHTNFRIVMPNNTGQMETQKQVQG